MDILNKTLVYLSNFRFTLVEVSFRCILKKSIGTDDASLWYSPVLGR